MTQSLALRLAQRVDSACRFNKLVAQCYWSRLRGKVTCLLYHRIAEHGEQQYLENAGVPFTPPSVFRGQLLELRRAGAAFFTLRDLADGRFPDRHTPGFVITFDDGFRDNFQVGLDILNDLAIPAVFFVATEMVGRSSLTWEHALHFAMASPRRREQLVVASRERFGQDVVARDLGWVWRCLATREDCNELSSDCRDWEEAVPSGDITALYPEWDDLRRASSSGYEIGSHTVSHRTRHLFTESEYLDELRRSKQHLEEQLQISVTSFSYPYNSYFFEDDKVALQAGYSQMATVDDGRLTAGQSLSWIPRLTVHAAHKTRIQFRRLVLEGRN